MKIRILSLCFLLLVSVVLTAQKPSKKKDKEREKEAAVQVDKKEAAREAAEMSAREAAAKEAGQRLKEKRPNWQNIPKLVVPPGRTIQLKSNLLQIDTLIMHPSSGLALAQGDNVMVVGHATIAPGAKIVGYGKKGADGRQGSSGEPTPRRRSASDGGRGDNGKAGGAAPNLKLYLGSISYRKPLSIFLSGGKGGKGGDGGDGGTRKTGCSKTGLKGTNGGNAGMGGNGGAGGELLLVLGDRINPRAISYQSQTGISGKSGLGGKPGLLIIKCLGKTWKSRPGIHGASSSFYVAAGEPDTNADFLEFPSPVPKPSASITVPIKIPAGSSYSTVDAKLKSALKACGYNNLNYRKYKDGFALFTGMENITGEGIPLSKPDRFSSKEVKFYNDPSLIAYLTSLFSARIGYSRIIVFIVTSKDKGVGTKSGGVARSEAIEWFESGLEDLPTEIGKRPFTEEHLLKALIYEFSKRENSSDPVFSEPSTLDADQHLKGASLWSLLITN